MKRIPQKVFFIILLYSWLTHVTGRFDLYNRSIKCNNIDPEYITNVTCHLKAKRGHKGLITFRYDMVKPVQEFWAHLQVFWRGSTGRFQPFMLDMDLDICEAPKYMNTTHPIIKLLFRGSSRFKTGLFFTNILKGCPISAPLRLLDYDSEVELKPFLPPIIPQGMFKFTCRMHDGQNRTLVFFQSIGEIRQRGTSDFINLG